MLRDDASSNLEILLSYIDSNGIDYTTWANANNGTTLPDPLNTFYLVSYQYNSAGTFSDLRQGDLTLTTYTDYFTLTSTDATRPSGSPDYLALKVLEIYLFQGLTSNADNTTFDNTDWPLKVNPIDSEAVLLGNRINSLSNRAITIIGGNTGEGDTRPDGGMLYPRGLDS